MSKELEAFELLYRFLVEEINTLRHKDLNEDYFYNEKYGVTMTDKKTGITYTIADIANALKRLEQYENETQSIGEMIAKKIKAFEIVKEYFILTSEYGKISFELKKNIPEDKYDLLKEVFK